VVRQKLRISAAFLKLARLMQSFRHPRRMVRQGRIQGVPNMSINIHPMQRTVATVAALFFTAVIFVSSFPHMPVA